MITRRLGRHPGCSFCCPWPGFRLTGHGGQVVTLEGGTELWGAAVRLHVRGLSPFISVHIPRSSGLSSH